MSTIARSLLSQDSSQNVDREPGEEPDLDAWDGRHSHVRFVGDGLRSAPATEPTSTAARIENEVITVVPGFDYEAGSRALESAEAGLRQAFGASRCFVPSLDGDER